VDDANDDKKWPELAAQAQAEAKDHLPDPDTLEHIKRAASRARAALGGDDVRIHSVPFDPDMWMLPPLALPHAVLSSKRISRGDAFAVASRPASPEANWLLFCTSFVFGYGTSGLGPPRLERILGQTSPADLQDLIAKVRRLLARHGPLRAYDHLCGDKRRGTVPHWGPAFYTKLLYFASIPGGARSALILDNQTGWMISAITGMDHFVDQHNRSERWTAYRFGVYLAWMTEVSAQLKVQPDFLEYALFMEAKRRRRQRPASTSSRMARLRADGTPSAHTGRMLVAHLNRPLVAARNS
jgi:Putative 8-oxoguanine DNA glycosylase OGG-like protein